MLPSLRIAKRDHLRLRNRAAATAALVLLIALPQQLGAEERATIVWKGEPHPVATIAGKEFLVSDAARALGYAVAADPGTGVLTLSLQGHQILVGPGTAQVPVDRRIVPISSPARVVAGALYAPTDFFERILFPLAGAAGGWDSGRKTWTLAPAGPPAGHRGSPVGARGADDAGRAPALLGGSGLDDVV